MRNTKTNQGCVGENLRVCPAMANSVSSGKQIAFFSLRTSVQVANLRQRERTSQSANAFVQTQCFASPLSQIRICRDVARYVSTPANTFFTPANADAKSCISTPANTFCRDVARYVSTKTKTLQSANAFVQTKCFASPLRRSLSLHFAEASPHLGGSPRILGGSPRILGGSPRGMSTQRYDDGQRTNLNKKIINKINNKRLQRSGHKTNFYMKQKFCIIGFFAIIGVCASLVSCQKEKKECLCTFTIDGKTRMGKEFPINYDAKNCSELGTKISFEMGTAISCK
jgi:hypothetical protein